MTVGKRKIFNTFFQGLCRSMAFLVIAVLIVILVKVVTNGVGVINLSFLFKAPTEGMTEGGIFPAIFGTVCITLLMIILAIPVGVSAAIYLTEYAGKNFLGRLFEPQSITLPVYLR